MDMALENLSKEELIALLSQKDATIEIHQKTNSSLHEKIRDLYPQNFKKLVEVENM